MRKTNKIWNEGKMTYFNLPNSKEEWEVIKSIFLRDYGIIDEPQSWLFILSQIQNVKMPELSTSYQTITAYYKRWKIGAILQDQKTIELEKLNAILEEKVKALAKEEELNGRNEQDQSDLNGDTREIIPQWSDLSELPQTVS